MTELTPDAASDAFRALTLAKEWMHGRFVSYVRNRLPNQKKLLAALSANDDPKTKRIAGLVENGFHKVLRLKVERGVLPPYGPVVSTDDLYFCAGVVLATFLEDLDEPEMVQRAAKWRPKGLGFSKGALNAALIQVCEEVGLPAFAKVMLVPLIDTVFRGQFCLHWPHSRRSARQELFEISGALSEVMRKHDLTLEQLPTQGSAMRDLFKELYTLEEFRKEIDTSLFSAGDGVLDDLKEGMEAAGQGLLEHKLGSEEDAEEMVAVADGAQSQFRSIQIALHSFFQREAEEIWGESAAESATP